MTDVAIQWQIVSGDIALSGANLATDEGLQTAVIVSLFTDRRAEVDDVVPDGSDDRRGWWADAYPNIEGDRIGSRLWLLYREKQLSSVLARSREYAEEALRWLLDDGIASAVRVQAEVVQQGMLGLAVEIERPARDVIEYRFQRLWEAT